MTFCKSAIQLKSHESICENILSLFVKDPAQPAPHSSRGDPARQLASVHRTGSLVRDVGSCRFVLMWHFCGGGGGDGGVAAAVAAISRILGLAVVFGPAAFRQCYQQHQWWQA